MAALHVAEVTAHPSLECLCQAPVLVELPRVGMQQPEVDDSMLEPATLSSLHMDIS